MRTQTDFYKVSSQKMPIIPNNTINIKYCQFPAFAPKNTFYGKQFINSNKSANNTRYFLNNNNRMVNIPKSRKNKSLSTSNKKPIRSNTNFYLSNINFYNSGSLDKNDNFNNKNILKIPTLKNNKYSSTTVPKKNPIYKIKNSSSLKYKLKNTNNSDDNFNKYSVNNINNINNDKNNNNINNLKNRNNNNYNYNIFFNQNISLEKLLNENYSMYQNAKHSTDSFGLISAYGVNTYRGIFRNYNEDRVSIIIDAKYSKLNNKDNNNEQMPKVCFFGVFDGHAGDKCCEYLKNYLHHHIFDSSNFPNSPIRALEQGFKNCEKSYMKSIHNKTRNQYYDYSGSCAIVVLIIDDTCYIANLGDSRALYSYDSGSKFYQLSRDHKPNDPKEKKRIYKAGGSIFKATLSQYGIPFTIKESDLGFKIPYRIIPGRLAVSYYLII